MLHASTSPPHHPSSDHSTYVTQPSATPPMRPGGPTSLATIRNGPATDPRRPGPPRHPGDGSVLSSTHCPSSACGNDTTVAPSTPACFLQRHPSPRRLSHLWCRAPPPTPALHASSFDGLAELSTFLCWPLLSSPTIHDGGAVADIATMASNTSGRWRI